MGAVPMDARRHGAACCSAASVTAQENGPTDWAGLWFKIVEEDSGEFVGMRAGRPSPTGTGMAWIFLPHYDHDGAGGLVKILREESPTADIPVPTLQSTDRPSWLARNWALLRFLSRRPRPAAAWKRWNPTWQPPIGGIKSPGTALANYTFDIERTKRLTEKARVHGVSVNSYLFSAAVRVTDPELHEGPVLWMMPVNMRGLVHMGRDTANYTAYLHLEVDRQGTPAAIHNVVKQAMRRCEHWGTWQFVNIGKLVGYAGMRRLYRYHLKGAKGRVSVGAFSNMGSWDGIGQWSVAPPVTSSCPVGIGVMTCNGSLSITIETHPSVAADAAFAKSLMAQLVAEAGV
jgi:hypothetical protein